KALDLKALDLKAFDLKALDPDLKSLDLMSLIPNLNVPDLKAHNLLIPKIKADFAFYKISLFYLSETSAKVYKHVGCLSCYFLCRI
ncbi:MAG: hypothetical protein RR235_05510, partial [Oscillospiraceae bacterium]